MTRNSEEMTLELCDPRDSRLSLGTLHGTLSSNGDTKPARAPACPGKVQKTEKSDSQAGLH